MSTNPTEWTEQQVWSQDGPLGTVSASQRLVTAPGHYPLGQKNEKQPMVLVLTKRSG